LSAFFLTAAINTPISKRSRNYDFKIRAGSNSPKILYFETWNVGFLVPRALPAIALQSKL
jgi:hypothetical protein